MKIDTSCLIVAAFIGASFITTVSTCIPCKTLKENLDDSQLEIYKTIVRERLYDYYVGLIIGIIIAISVYKYNSNDNNNKILSMCIYLAIILSTQFLYYMLVPKSKYMLEYLREDQTKMWLETYKTMKNQYYLGALFGIIAFVTVYLYNVE